MTKKLTSKSKTKKKETKKSKRPQDLAVDRREEWRFELPLSAIVEGKIQKGKPFKEETTLENISSGGAYFCLDSGVTVGSKLNLVIDIPNEISEGKKVRLQLGGLTVRLEKPDKKEKKQGVAIRFNKKFEFISEDE
jgi:c-di-GMP-binding flagellar brake protein YcgR